MEEEMLEHLLGGKPTDEDMRDLIDEWRVDEEELDYKHGNKYMKYIVKILGHYFAIAAYGNDTWGMTDFDFKGEVVPKKKMIEITEYVPKEA